MSLKNYDVKNISMLSAIRFFLENENELKKGETIAESSEVQS